MGNAAIAKPLILGLLHLRKCKAEDPEKCEECVRAATRIGSVMSEVVEVCELVRQVSAKAQQQMGLTSPTAPPH